MNPLKRLVRFGMVGVLATLIHLGMLLICLRLAVTQTGLANVCAFIVAFVVSTTLQQRYTFADRLDGQVLKKRSVLLLFLLNSIVAYLLGAQTKGPFLLLLAFVPAVVNYTILHFFSGHPSFKR
ncbi:MAG: GtrA family protein [Cyanobacteriota bacterium]|nr:GtrA family protein [Cyanobacteriota bacterium]